ncbi:MAG: leucine-rich repeat domain-containing protein [Firmicutes bacterium]|nr:leucine-rich repeat domain-containing protein [Bacillota bacterium]
MKKSLYFYFKILMLSAVFCLLGISVGCSTEFIEPFDFGGLRYEYELVSHSDGKYIVITKHIVSETDVVIPDSIYGIPVREVADSAFAGDMGIKSVSIGKNLQTIGGRAFSECTALETVTYDNGLYQVGEGAFYGCTSLKSFARTVSPSDISSSTAGVIENAAFYGCTALKSVEFMQNTAEIGDYTFSGCTSLKSVKIPQSVSKVGRGAFYGCKSLVKIQIPDKLSSVGGRAFAETQWLGSQKQEFVTVGNGILIQYNGKGKNVELPARVRQISGAFAGNRTVESIIFNTNLRVIGDMAFMGCTSLTSVTIPNKVTAVGDEAFCGCSSLKSVSFGSGTESIGKNAFKYCDIVQIYLPRNSAAHKYCAANNLDYSFNDD